MAGDRGLGLVVVGLIAFSSLWVANTRFLRMQPKTAAVSDSSRDADFLKAAMERQMAEVLIGELAARRAATSAMKQFAGRIVNDYARLNDELNRIAAFKGVRFPARLTSEDQAAYDFLSSLTGAEFDQTYADRTLVRRGAELAELQDEAANGAHPEIKRFAQHTLAIVEEHLRLIQNATAQIAVTTAAVGPALGFL
jgi:putative membrane protein